MESISVTNKNYLITTNQQVFNYEKIYDFISNQSYWAAGIPMDILKRSIANSLSFGLFYNGEQIGFARVITDYATFGYLADVFIDPKFRGKGLASWLMETILSHPALPGLRRWMLATRDAHGLYEKYGFTKLLNSERIMEISKPGIYQSSDNSDN